LGLFWNIQIAEESQAFQVFLRNNWNNKVGILDLQSSLLEKKKKKHLLKEEI
jgi:hypothetical protein